MFDKESDMEPFLVQASECVSPPSSYASIGLAAGTTITTEQISSGRTSRNER